MKKEIKFLIVGLNFAMLLLFELPLMSIYSVLGEASLIPIHGYNLPQFGLCGWICLLTPITCCVILLLKQGRLAKLVEMGVLLASFLICYALCMINAYDWLYSLEESAVTMYPGLFILPAVITVVFTASNIVDIFVLKD